MVITAIIPLTMAYSTYRRSVATDPTVTGGDVNACQSQVLVTVTFIFFVLAIMAHCQPERAGTFVLACSHSTADDARVFHHGNQRWQSELISKLSLEPNGFDNQGNM